MRKKRVFACLLLIGMLFVSVSCKKTENKPSEIGIQLIASDFSGYSIVVPETLSTQEKDAINAFVKAVHKDFGYLLKINNDVYTAPTEKEILVGYTNRPQTETVTKMLRYGEFFVGFEDGKLVILGSTPADTVLAIEHFSDLILQRKDEAVLFDSVQDLCHEEKTFELPDLLLNGVSFSEYTLLYPDMNTKREKRFAELIRNVVMDRTGIMIPVQSDKKDAYGNILLVGGKSAQAGFRANEDVVEVVGNTEYDLFFAVQTFVDRIADSEGEIEIAESEALSYTQADLDLLAYGLTPDRVSIMSYNVQNAGGGAFDVDSKYPQLAAVFDSQTPDFICMQECVNGTGAADAIRKKMTNKDSYATIRGDKNADTATAMSAILYNSTKYKLIASDTILLRKAKESENNLWDRYFTWAKVQNKATGTTFVVISAHVDYVEDYANEEFLKMLTYVNEHFEGLPVLIAGDYNLMKPAALFTNLDAQGYEDTRETADHTKNGNAPTFPENDLKGPRTIDFIYERGFSTDYYEVVIPTQNASDHRPIYAECYIDLYR